MKRLLVPDYLKAFTDIDRPLAPLTTWDVGGTAQIMIAPRRTEELVLALRWLYSCSSLFAVLGGGSNVLVSDGVIDTPIVYTGALKEFETSVKDGHVFILCGAGVPLKKLFAMAINEGWSGLEFAAGIPGTIGGAVAGNAGTAQGAVASVVEEIETVGAGGSKSRWGCSDITWGYRRCSLMDEKPCVISSVTLKLKLSERSAVAARARLSGRDRRKQPVGVKTAGCVFKNTPHESAGKLLDCSGCKGLTVGGARVSHKHANFIENYECSSASDIAELVIQCRNMVQKKFNVLLQFEIKPMGFPADFFGG